MIILLHTLFAIVVEVTSTHGVHGKLMAQHMAPGSRILTGNQRSPPQFYEMSLRQNLPRLIYMKHLMELNCLRENYHRNANKNNWFLKNNVRMPYAVDRRPFVIFPNEIRSNMGNQMATTSRRKNNQMKNYVTGREEFQGIVKPTSLSETENAEEKNREIGKVISNDASLSNRSADVNRVNEVMNEKPWFHGDLKRKEQPSTDANTDELKKKEVNKTKEPSADNPDANEEFAETAKPAGPEDSEPTSHVFWSLIRPHTFRPYEVKEIIEENINVDVGDFKKSENAIMQESNQEKQISFGIPESDISPETIPTSGGMTGALSDSINSIITGLIEEPSEEISDENQEKQEESGKEQSEKAEGESQNEVSKAVADDVTPRPLDFPTENSYFPQTLDNKGNRKEPAAPVRSPQSNRNMTFFDFFGNFLRQNNEPKVLHTSHRPHSNFHFERNKTETHKKTIFDSNEILESGKVSSAARNATRKVTVTEKYAQSFSTSFPTVEKDYRITESIPPQTTRTTPQKADPAVTPTATTAGDSKFRLTDLFKFATALNPLKAEPLVPLTDLFKYSSNEKTEDRGSRNKTAPYFAITEPPIGSDYYLRKQKPFFTNSPTSNSESNHLNPSARLKNDKFLFSTVSATKPEHGISYPSTTFKDYFIPEKTSERFTLMEPETREMVTSMSTDSGANLFRGKQFEESVTPKFEDFTSERLTFDLLPNGERRNLKINESLWKNGRKIHFDQESDGPATADLQNGGNEQEQRRSDILISDVMEDYETTQSHITSLGYVDSLKQNLSKSNFSIDWLVPVIPKVIDDLRRGKVTDEDLPTLSQAFGKYWPEIVILSNDTNLDVLPLLKMKEEKDLKHVLENFITYKVETTATTTTQENTNNSDDVTNYSPSDDYMYEYKDIYEDIIGQDVDDKMKKKFRAKREENSKGRPSENQVEREENQVRRKESFKSKKEEEEDALRKEATQEYFESLEEEEKERRKNDYLYDELFFDGDDDAGDTESSVFEIVEIADLTFNLPNITSPSAKSQSTKF